jgi:hypothetical protein
MAQKLTLNQRPATKQGRKQAAPTNPNRLPKVIALVAGAGALLALSLTQVARVSPSRADVNGIVKEIRKERPAANSNLPTRTDATRGAKMWVKKGAKG